MRIAIVTEGSTKSRNADVAAALGHFDHEIINLGMHNTEGETDLTYIDTALMSAISIHLGIADFVVGGCGTGQGYMNAVLQFPGMFCGLLTDPVEAWLFAHVNAGNCISLQLNKGYGLGGDINVRFLLERMFSVEFGSGYPAARREIQQGARANLRRLSEDAHKPFAEILSNMDHAIINRVANLPSMASRIISAPDSAAKKVLAQAIKGA